MCENSKAMMDEIAYLTETQDHLYQYIESLESILKDMGYIIGASIGGSGYEAILLDHEMDIPIDEDLPFK